MLSLSTPQLQRGLSGGYLAFFFLAFGWLLMAGLINATRFGYIAHSIASVRNYPTGQATGLFSRGQYVGPPLTTTMNWSLVDAGTWARLSWAGMIAIGGIFGLLLVVVYRRRASPDQRRRLFRGAWALFGIYAGWHIVTFIGEVLSYW